MSTKIPGNRFSEKKLWGDETAEWLHAELSRIVGAQSASKRNSPRYVQYTRRLHAALQAVAA